ncbi:HAD-IA family hydrolase [Crenobacter sp. SG2305]|uniref:HAD-IA family hydrolase n=1 Tax=Crenobacter oryzisoli TaxID=3056844 RepID=UPI0025AAABC6|nr:HAD-IA family hydrolase [Crenobacter sp. SG2305]MDN0084856.1 HAD-IA family hydrolase [Crenobacter sp. SG2305]
MDKPFDLIVFDWDGTLMDSTAHIVHTIQAACADLGLPVPERERASHVIGLGLIDAMRYVCPGLPPSRYEEMGHAYKHHYVLGTETIELFDGVREGLAELRASGVFLAVATGKGRPGLDDALARTGLTSLFDATRTVNECASKPHPEMLLSLADELGVENRRTLMVGDTSHDLNMANNAGTRGVGVSYGAHPIDELLACNPLAIFDSFRSFHAWLQPQLG